MNFDGWRDVHIGFDNADLNIKGIPIWSSRWRSTGDDAVHLPRPAHPHQRHRFDIYEVGPMDKPVRFAAGELSNVVWGFYVPTE